MPSSGGSEPREPRRSGGVFLLPRGGGFGRELGWWERVRLWFRPVEWRRDPYTMFEVGMKELDGRWYVVATRGDPSVPSVSTRTPSSADAPTDVPA